MSEDLARANAIMEELKSQGMSLVERKRVSYLLMIGKVKPSELEIWEDVKDSGTSGHSI